LIEAGVSFKHSLARHVVEVRVQGQYTDCGVTWGKWPDFNSVRFRSDTPSSVPFKKCGRDEGILDLSLTDLTTPQQDEYETDGQGGVYVWAHVEVSLAIVTLG
jgi:hypothetical protein